jgi:hypothetical protein
MRRFTLIISVSFIIITLFGCQFGKDEKVNMTLLDRISQISISNSEGFGGLNENFIFSSNVKAVTSNFEEIMERSLLTNKKIDKDSPDYDIFLEYDNQDTHGLHLILGNSGKESYLTYIGHEDKVYKVSPKDTDKIRKMLND